MIGWRVIVTRPVEHAERLAAELQTLGIEPVAVPAISFEPPATYEPLDDAIHHLDRYQWVMFTSRTGVRVFFERVAAQGRWIPTHLRWATVGPGTADVLRAHHVEHVWMPSRLLSATLGDELPAQRGERVLRIRAQAASPLPAKLLRSRGIDVDEVVAYHTVEAPPESVPLLREAFAGGTDAVVFTSASTVRGFWRLLQDADLVDRLPDLTIVAIGPVTAAAIRAVGWPVHLEANEHSIDGIAALFRRRQGHAAGIPRG
ncbi:MAG: uroporphyrinogen-III synthase [bacterium]